MPTLRYQNDDCTFIDGTSRTIAISNEPIQVSIALSPCAKSASSLTEEKATFSGEQSYTALNYPHPPRGGQPQAVSDARSKPQAQLHDNVVIAAPAFLPATQASLKRTKKIAKPRTSKGGAKAASSLARKLPSKKRAPPTKKSMAGSVEASHTTALSVEHAGSVSEGINAQSATLSTTLQLKRGKASSSRARKLPTKLTWERAGPKTPAACATEVTESSQGGSNNDSLIHSKQSPNTIDGGARTSTEVVSQRPAKTVGRIKGLVSLDPQDNNEHIAKKRKKVKTAKSDNIVQGGEESLSGSNAEQSKRSSNETNLEDFQIKEAVNDVAGVIADDIIHCPFLFELANRPKIIISGEMEGEFNKKIYVAPNGQGRSYNPCDINSIVEVVRRFAVEVYYPFLLSARQSVKNISRPNVDRIRLSTLLAIREMLIMNGATLFTCSTLKSLSERLYLSHVFANAIVRNTAKRLHANAVEGTFFADFIQATHNYDAKTEDFQFALTRADARSVYVHQGGYVVGPEESIVAKIGFNYARERHPLLRNNSVHVKESGDALVVNDRPLACAAPTACAAFHIESATGGAADQGDDDSEILKSFSVC